VETFLLKTLEDERLSKAARHEKDAILKKLKVLQEEYPQLQQFESERETANTVLTDSQRQPIHSDNSSGNLSVFIAACSLCHVLYMQNEL